MMEQNKCKSPINVWVQVGPNVLIAASEIFASVVSLEYAYTKAPKSMRSLVQSFALLTSAISSLLGLAFKELAEDPKLVWNYTVVAVICFVGGCAFYWTYKDLDKQEDRLNMLPAGKHLDTSTGAAGDAELAPKAG